MKIKQFLPLMALIMLASCARQPSFHVEEQQKACESQGAAAHSRAMAQCVEDARAHFLQKAVDDECGGKGIKPGTPAFEQCAAAKKDAISRQHVEDFNASYAQMGTPRP